MINDDEIDLTEHRDFRENISSPLFIRNAKGEIFSNISSYINNMVRKQFYGKFPWAVESDILDKRPKYDYLIALGNSEMRKETLLYYTWGTSDNLECDCCGKKYKKMPWKLNSGFCEECDKVFNKRNKIPWQ